MLRLVHLLIRAVVLLLIAAFGAGAAFAASGNWSHLSYPFEAQELGAQPVDLAFAARAPPANGGNLTSTGAAFAQTRDLRASDGSETTGAVYAFFRSSIAPNMGLFDFNRGRTTGSYDALNPGPLDDSLAGTFSGGRYNEVVLTEDVVLHRAGTGDRPLGQIFTQQPAGGILQSRIDSAVLPRWPGGGTSPIDSTFEVRIPAGTRVYVGEVSSQGGAFVGGTQQIVVPRPWEIDGVEVLSRSPLP